MDLSVSPLTPPSALLPAPTVTVTVDGVAVPPSGAGTFTFDPGVPTPFGEAGPSTVRVRLTFRAFLGATNSVALDVDQTFSVAPLSLSPLAIGAITAVRYAVPGAGDTAGLHPLLRSVAVQSIGVWRLVVDTTVVDVTGLLSTATLDRLRRPTPNSSVRVLARTDGTIPVFWITATPMSCRSAAATDLLCFLTPPQKSPPSSGNPATDLAGPTMPDALSARVAIFLGGTTPTGIPGVPGTIDRFTPGPVLANFVQARGFESAVVSAGRNVTLVLPVPAGGGYAAAAGPRLPALLTDAFRLLHALGDIITPDRGGSAIPRARPTAPKLGLGGHSLAGLSVFAAVKTQPAAYREIWLFDATGVAANLATLAAAKSAGICIAGFDRTRADQPFRAAAAMPSLAGRVRRLPDPDGYPALLPGDPDAAGLGPADAAFRAQRAVTATVRQLLRRSSGLSTAVSGLAAPPFTFTPRPPFTRPGTKAIVNERFEMLHQYVVQGGDNRGGLAPTDVHFLTQALLTSSLG